jgi:hypothetical protein
MDCDLKEERANEGWGRRVRAEAIAAKEHFKMQR